MSSAVTAAEASGVSAEALSARGLLLVPSTAWTPEVLEDLAAGLDALPPAARAFPGGPLEVELDDAATPWGLGDAAHPLVTDGLRRLHLFAWREDDDARARAHLTALTEAQRRRLWRRRAVVHAVLRRWDERLRWSHRAAWRRLSGWRGNDALLVYPWAFSRRAGMASPELDLATFGEELLVPAESLRADAVRVDERVRCVQPSKARFLDERLHALDPSWRPARECPAFDDWAALDRVRGVEVVFAAPSAVSSQALFGHVLLRVVRDGDKEAAGGGQVMQLAALVSPFEPRLSYVWRGLTGGFRGVYALSNVADVQHEALGLEQRSLRRFALALSEPERAQLLERLWELERVGYLEYRFFTANCSTMLRFLLEPVLGDDAPGAPLTPWESPTQLLDALAPRLQPVGVDEASGAVALRARDDVRRLVSEAPGDVRAALGGAWAAVATLDDAEDEARRAAYRGLLDVVRREAATAARGRDEDGLRTGSAETERARSAEAPAPPPKEGDGSRTGAAAETEPARAREGDGSRIGEAAETEPARARDENGSRTGLSEAERARSAEAPAPRSKEGDGSRTGAAAETEPARAREEDGSRTGAAAETEPARAREEDGSRTGEAAEKEPARARDDASAPALARVDASTQVDDERGSSSDDARHRRDWLARLALASLRRERFAVDQATVRRIRMERSTLVPGWKGPTTDELLAARQRRFEAGTTRRVRAYDELTELLALDALLRSAPRRPLTASEQAVLDAEARARDTFSAAADLVAALPEDALAQALENERVEQARLDAELVSRGVPEGGHGHAFVGGGVASAPAPLLRLRLAALVEQLGDQRWGGFSPRLGVRLLDGHLELALGAATHVHRAGFTPIEVRTLSASGWGWGAGAEWTFDEGAHEVVASGEGLLALAANRRLTNFLVVFAGARAGLHAQAAAQGLVAPRAGLEARVQLPGSFANALRVDAAWTPRLLLGGAPAAFQQGVTAHASLVVRLGVFHRVALSLRADGELRWWAGDAPVGQGTLGLTFD